jgi:hypothetical protein
MPDYEDFIQKYKFLSLQVCDITFSFLTCILTLISHIYLSKSTISNPQSKILKFYLCPFLFT